MHAVEFYLSFLQSFLHHRLQTTGYRHVRVRAIARVVLNDHIGFAVVRVACLVFSPQFNELGTEVGAGKRYTGLRRAVGVCRKARAGAFAADGNFDLVFRCAVVFRVLEEIAGPKYDHVRRHDVRAQPVEAYHRRRLAVFHNEFVFAHRFVAAAIFNNPLDLVGAVGQLRYNVRARRLGRIPPYRSRFGLCGEVGGRLQCKTVFLVERNRTVVERTRRAAAEVRVGCVAELYVVETWQVGARDHRFHVAVLIQIEEQQVADVHVFTTARIGCRDRQVGRRFAQVVRADRVFPPVHFIPELVVVRCQITNLNRRIRTVDNHRILVINHFDDLFVRVAVGVGIPERREVRRLRIRRIDANHRRSPRARRARCRNDRTRQVLRRVHVDVRVRVRYVDTIQVRVVRAPVDDRPRAFDLVTSVGHHSEQFVVVRYGQQFAVFTEERRLIEERAVAGVQNFIVRETNVVVLLEVHHDALRACAGLPGAIHCRETAGDRAFVTRGIEVGQDNRGGDRIHAAVVRCGSSAVSPEAWVEVFAGYCYVGRSRAHRFEFVVDIHLNHTVVRVARAVDGAEHHRYGITQVGTAERYRRGKLVGDGILVTGTVDHTRYFETFEAAVVVGAVVKRRSVHDDAAVGTEAYLREFVAGNSRRYEVGNRQVKLTARDVAALVFGGVTYRVGIVVRQALGEGEYSQCVRVPVVVAGEIGQRTGHCEGRDVARVRVNTGHFSFQFVDVRASFGDDYIGQGSCCAAGERINRYRYVGRTAELRSTIVADTDALGKGNRVVRAKREAFVAHLPRTVDRIAACANVKQFVGIRHRSGAKTTNTDGGAINTGASGGVRCCSSRIQVGCFAVDGDVGWEYNVDQVKCFYRNGMRANGLVAPGIGNYEAAGNDLARVAALAVVNNFIIHHSRGV